jgi:hypothetical protein
MFTIDLLKGKGVPAKTGPEGVAIVVAAFAVPLIIALVMLGGFLRSRIVISIQTGAIANYDAKIIQLADAVQLQKSFENEKNIVNCSLAEVASNIGGHIQWSPVLVALVENMPGPVFLTQLDVKQNNVKVKMPQKDDPKKTIETQVPAKTLQMSLFGSSQAGCDKEVRDFRVQQFPLRASSSSKTLKLHSRSANLKKRIPFLTKSTLFLNHDYKNYYETGL